MEIILEILQATVLVGSLIGGAFTLVTYWRNSRLRRAEWLSSLHEKFFEQLHYKRMRRIIDYEEPELATLRQAIMDGTNNELTEALVDYLNFFEFIATLRKLNQLSYEEIAMGFAYYLRRLADFEFIVNFIQTSGFENLDALIKDDKRQRTGLPKGPANG